MTPLDTKPRISLYQRPNGYFYAASYWPDKRTRYSSLNTKDRALAERRLALWTAKVLPAIIEERAQPQRRGGADLAQAADWYETRYLPIHHAARSTVENYRSAINRFVAFAKGRGVTEIPQLTSRLFQDWQAAEGLGRARVRDDLLAVRLWLRRYAESEVLELPSITWNIPPVKRSRRFRALTVEQCAVLVQTLRERRPDVAAPVEWMLLTGWRVGDVLSFRWDEIRGGVIDRSQLKTGADLAYPVTDAMAGLLDALPGDRDGFVFRKATGKGNGWRYPDFMERFKEATKALPFKASPRDLRVTFATRKAEAGCPMPVLAELLGHRDPQLAARYYVRVSAEAKREWAGR